MTPIVRVICMTIKHLGAVSINAMVGPWPNVRRWSQHVWDLIERGKCKWSDYQLIQDERFRLSYMNLPHQAGASSQASAAGRQGPPPQAPTGGAICRDLNSVSGCRHNGSHEDGNLRYVHVCAHCDSIGRRSPHPYHRCRARFDNVGNQGHASDSSQDGRNWHQYGSRSYHRGHHSYSQGHSQHTAGSHQDQQPKTCRWHKTLTLCAPRQP